MKDKYMEELIKKIQAIEVWIKEQNKCVDYSTGIPLLLERFTEHKKNGGMKTYSLYDNAVTTCMGNDYGYEFFQNLWNFY